MASVEIKRRIKMKRFIDNREEPRTAVIAVIIQRIERSKPSKSQKAGLSYPQNSVDRGYISDTIFIT